MINRGRKNNSKLWKCPPIKENGLNWIISSNKKRKSKTISKKRPKFNLLALKKLNPKFYKNLKEPAMKKLNYFKKRTKNC